MEVARVYIVWEMPGIYRPIDLSAEEGRKYLHLIRPSLVTVRLRVRS